MHRVMSGKTITATRLHALVSEPSARPGWRLPTDQRSAAAATAAQQAKRHTTETERDTRRQTLAWAHRERPERAYDELVTVADALRIGRKALVHAELNSA